MNEEQTAVGGLEYQDAAKEAFAALKNAVGNACYTVGEANTAWQRIAQAIERGVQAIRRLEEENAALKQEKREICEKLAEYEAWKKRKMDKAIEEAVHGGRKAKQITPEEALIRLYEARREHKNAKREREMDRQRHDPIHPENELRTIQLGRRAGVALRAAMKLAEEIIAQKAKQ